MPFTGKLVLNLECLNSGGPRSLLRLADSPGGLEIEVAASESSVAALAAWNARPGEIYSVAGPKGDWYRARLSHSTSSAASFIPFARLNRCPESPLTLTVCQALPDKERFELVLEKLT